METMKKCSTCGTAYKGGVCPNCMAVFIQNPIEITAPDESAPLRPGQIFHGLEVTELLGKGGMGVVYKARQPALNRFVALKLLPGKMAEDPEFQARFQREAQALAALSHPNIVSVYDFGSEGSLFFFVMEFVDGVNLREILHQKKLAPEEAFKIVPQLCDALEYAHGEGVVHRDIKPENILIDKKGRVKIADFGLAKLSGQATGPTLTKTDVAMGTPRYMAPEQFESTKGVDHRADIYSMGVVFYEMLTGEVPMGHFDPPSRKVDVDVRIDRVVLKALEREPERRYQSAGAVKTDVTKVTVPVPKAQTTVPVAAGRKRIAWVAGPIVLACVFLGGVLLLDHSKPMAGKGDEATSSNVQFELEPLRTSMGAPVGAKHFKGHFYELFEQKVSWHEAKKRCEEMRGHLVTITSAEENAFVMSLTRTVWSWIGLSDEKGQNDWTWVTAEPIGYTAWKAGAPDYLGGEKWGVINSGGRWDNQAKNQNSFICEWEPAIVRPSRVPADAKEFNGHFYKLFEEDLTWHQAKKRSEDMGGHLVTITSKEESAFIKTLKAREIVWIGLTDDREEGNWQWITGEPFGFSDWESTEPRGGRTENWACLSLVKARTWNDYPKNRVGQLLCEWEPYGQVDLLGSINLARDVAIGESSWSLAQGKLAMQAGAVAPVLELPCDPTDEYDLLLGVIRVGGTVGPLAVGLVSSGSQFVVEIDNSKGPGGESISYLWMKRFGNSEGNPTRASGGALGTKDSHLILVSVRRRSVSVVVNGKQIIDWKGSLDQLTVSKPVRNPRRPFLSAHRAAFEIERIVLTPR
jgi:tRNA A-37 threonylcarbamoyl transferase component Bud32